MTYQLDGGPATPYSAPVVVTTNGAHTIVVTATDGAGNPGTATSTFTITRDVTAPTAGIALSGTATATPDTYAGPVTATVTAADTGGSGLASTTIDIDGGAPVAYTAPVTISAPGSHTVHVVATDANGNTTSTSSTFTIAGGAATVTSPDDAVAIAGRLHFASPVNQAKPARAVTVTNSGAGSLTVTGLTISGPQASAFALNAGQATTFTLAPGASATVSIVFRPLTGAPTENYATLTIATNATGASPTIALAGLSAAAYFGTSEPPLQNIFNVLGFGGVNVGGTNLGGTRLPKGDEVIAPYFVAANPAQPVSFIPLARYLSATTCQCSRSGWGPKGTTTRNQLWYVNDNGATGTNFNQTLLPTTTGTTQFTTTGAFGLYTENGWWLDDGRNASATHLLRAYPAKKTDGTTIPDTYLIGLDYGTGTAGKNFDFQDIVFIAKNVRPEVVATALRPTGLNLEYATNPTTTVLDSVGTGTGSQTVQANTAGTQYDPSKLLVTTAAGGTLTITSTAGTHVGRTAAVNNQVNALESIFDGSRYKHSITGQLHAPFNLTANGQFEGIYYGPGQDDFLRVGLQRVSGVTRLVAFYEVQGVGPLAETFQSATLASVVPDLTSVTTIQVRITADVSNGTVQASYQLNGAGGFVNLGTAPAPRDVMRWFSTQARAGVVTSNAGSTTTFTSTFDSLKGATA
jgi:hypothetical protein